jgi:glycosyltransferase involved in cell wall biosynthesis
MWHPGTSRSHIYNGVDTDSFSPGDRHEAQNARSSGIANRDRHGRPSGSVKDHRGLIGRSATGTRHDARLLIVGDGPCRAELEHLINELGLSSRVHLLGERDDIPRVLRALDIFTLPSLGEGISNVILEAMATGLPVVATRVGGNPELVRDGVTGFLVARRSADALAAALHRYVEDPLLVRRHGDAGRMRVVDEFSLSRMFAAYGDLYSRATERAAAR